MSATLSGLMALENPTPLDESPSTVSFDGQMWLGPEQILTGVFRYYNSSNMAFPDVGRYFLWIHVRQLSFPSSCLTLHNTIHTQVAKFDVSLHTQDEKLSSTHDDETHQQSKQDLKDDVLTQSDGSSQTLQYNNDIVHVVGDIIHVCHHSPLFHFFHPYLFEKANSDKR